MKIEEIVVSEKRLGRHVNHDPRSRNFAFKTDEPLVSAKHESKIDILDQGHLGSCTGNATVGALGCSPYFETLSGNQRALLTEDGAISIYSRATAIDPFPGTYQPDDTGSDGLSAAKAAQELKLISGYQHALSLNDALAALSKGPVIFGTNWYEGFDQPDATGNIVISGVVRGGHEVCLDEIDVEKKLVWIKNSWGTSWGIGGRANMDFDTLGKLLSEKGDVTIFVPITSPAPVPVVTQTDDERLAAAAKVWLSKRHVWSVNKKLVDELTIWLNAKAL